MQQDLDQLRQFYLRDIHCLRSYRPGKNSFVEGPDRRWGRYKAVGERFTLLDVKGPGSVRHIWSTWSPGKGNHRLEFYVDGEARPSMSGTLDELIASVQHKRSPPVLGFVGNKGARNLFLPVPFQRHIRLDMITIEPTWLIFYQIDYRLGDCSAGILPASGDSCPHKASVAVPAGGRATVATLAGPSIVRRWQMKTDAPLTEHDRLQLEIRYDGATTAAVRASLADFFGPFPGVSFQTDPATGARTCYLPMPFRHSATFTLVNRLARPVKADFEADVEPVAAWDSNWGYFHALGQQTPRTTGYRQHQVLYVRGRGHWLGMALYNTGHDHGGGDFAVIDAEGDDPAFLHGINGEDYFTFAWFGRGAHHPFAIAHTNEEGRYRHHFENPYPFQKGLSICWGTYPGLATRSVAYWYQDSPEDTTVADDDNPLNADWDCFGPVPLKLDESFRPVGDPYAVLPSVADLDAGKQFECRCVSETFTAGWMNQRSIGPMLDLTYLSRHGTKIKGEVELGGMGHAFLARRKLFSPVARQVTFQISHDDPLRVLVNGHEAYRGGMNYGFATRRFPVSLRAGKNEIVVQLANFFNVTFNWAGFALRELV